MENRRVIIGPFQMGFLAGFDSVANPDDSTPNSTRLDVEGLFYASMIQAGIEEFVSMGKLTLKSESDFLEKRRVQLPAREWAKAVQEVTASISKFLPDDFQKDKTCESINLLIHFMSDLALAVKTKSSIVQMAPLPNVDELKSILPHELRFAFTNFMSAIESESATLPLPKYFLSSDQFQRFQHVLCSDVFAKYSLKHRRFENGRILKIDAINQVETMGQRLLKANGDLLKLRRLGVSIIPVSTKIVDTVFGKLPGALADFFGQQLSNWLKEERRIVIYRFDPVVKSVWSERQVLMKPRVPS